MLNDRPRHSQIFVCVILLCCVVAIPMALTTGRRGIGYATLGLASMCVSWLLAKRKPALWLLLPGVLLVLFYVWRSTLLSHTAPSNMNSRTFDLFALSLDGSFGTQPSVWVHQVISPVWLRNLLQVVYEGLPFAMGVAYATVLAQKSRALKLFSCFLVTGLLGVLCYRLAPVCGPAYLPFGDDCFYYDVSCSMDNFYRGVPYLISIDAQWPRNGMPSLHMCWALLVWWSMLDKPLGRLLGSSFALLTGVSTLVYGEHYLIDLLAAFFFALIPWAVFLAGRPVSQPRQTFSIVLGALGYLAFVVSIRLWPTSFSLHSWIPWTVLILSITGPLTIVLWSKPITPLIAGASSN